MKKWLATFATIAAVCIVTPQAQAAEEVNVGETIQQDGVKYRIVVGESGNKEAEVLGTASLTNREHVTIADYVKGIAVTSIAPSAFYVAESESDDIVYDDIQSVTLPSTLKKIGASAFYRTSISSITLPNGLAEIGESAFAQTSLQEMTIPNTVTTIGSKAFYGAAISTLTIPNSVQTLGSYIMSGELGKVELKLPEHFTTEKGERFENLYYEEFTHNGKTEVRINGYDRTKKLETITIPETINGATVTEIGAYSFQKEPFIYDDGIEAAKQVIMPTTIRKVGDYAFQGLTRNTFNISDYTNLQHIGTKAFERNGITNREPFVVTKDMYIGEHAFFYNQLTSVVIEDGVTHVPGAFRHNEITAITLPTSVTHIADEAFGNNEITDVQMPPNVEKIGKQSFVNNDIQEVELPASVTDIGEQAFASNNIKTPIVIRAAQTVGDEAFMDNEIPTVTIEEGVTELPIRIFKSNQLTDVQLPSTLTSLGVEAFANNELTDVFIPHLSSYGSGIFADNPITSATFEEGMTYIPEAMLMSTNLQHVELPSTVTTIQAGAFRFSKLTSVTLPHALQVIEDYAFSDNALTAVTLPSSLTHLFNGAFANNRLTTLTIPENVREISDEAFQNNVLTDVTLPHGLTTIWRWAFQNNHIKTLTIPSTVTSISESAFANNDLTSVTLPKNITTIGSSAFAGNALTKVELPSMLQVIGSDAFARNKLTSVTWAPMLRSIGDYAFATNPITTLVLPADMAKFDISMFLYDVEPNTFPYDLLQQIVLQGSNTIISYSKPIPKLLGVYTDANLTKRYDKLNKANGTPMTLYLSWETLQPETPKFSDTAGHWAQGAIESFTQLGYINGYPDGTFKPGAPIQRKHVARILNDVFKFEAVKEAADFKDVPKSHPYYAAISAVQQAGIFSGDNGKFQPEANLTRGQLAKVLVLSAKFEPGGKTTFKDTPSTYWGTPYVSTLADLAIVKGTDGLFNPHKPITRAQFVSMTSLALAEMERRANE